MPFHAISIGYRLCSPCEDIMGTNWLRMAAWVVASASVIGNLAVIVVLASSSFPIAVSRFLMINLATADLCMGIYLFLIIGMDFHSSGSYFNYAIDWQNGKLSSIWILIQRSPWKMLMETTFAAGSLEKDYLIY